MTRADVNDNDNFFIPYSPEQLRCDARRVREKWAAIDDDALAQRRTCTDTIASSGHLPLGSALSPGAALSIFRPTRRVVAVVCVCVQRAF